jgi:hypothetical protein
MRRRGTTLRGLMVALGAGAALLLAVPASATPPSLRAIVLVASNVAPPAVPPSPACVSSWARVTVSAYGRDRWQIRRVRFVLGSRLVGVDETTPYQLVVLREDLSSPSVPVVARVEMRDGRRGVVSRTLRHC